MDIKKMNLPTVAMVCASTAFAYKLFGTTRWWAPGMEVNLLYSVSAIVLVYAWVDRAKPIEKFFRRAGLENNNEAPWIIRRHKKEDGCTYIIHMPPGMCMSDFIKKKEALEQFLGEKVDFRFEKDLIIETTQKVLKDKYEFKLYEYNEPLKIALGYTRKELFTIDFEKAVHTLIAGTTGSGKSVCLRTIIAGLMFKPQSRLVINLVDFMKVELGIFKNSSRINSFSTTPEEFYKLLTQLKFESERRLQLFDEKGVTDIQKYNKVSKVKLPYIISLVDEFAALGDKEYKYIHSELKLRCAQDRKCGIHYVLCTQRPSRDIIDGTIKANIPTRLAFKTASDQDSEIVLDMKGAEQLKGKGHGLVNCDGSFDEIQTMFLDVDECQKLIAHTIKPKIAVLTDDTSGVMNSVDR
jgi:energy-coupling factor transporter ATP-binding protein EcfA2